MRISPASASKLQPVFSKVTPEAPAPALATPPLGHDGASHFEVEGSKQARPRRGASPAVARLRELTDPSAARLRSLNPTPGPQNCPATAGAVDHFMRTGEVRPADRGDGLVHYEFPNRFTRTSQADLRRALARDGSHLVVRGVRSPETADAMNLTTEHYFVVVNDQGRLRAVDAYNHQVLDLDQMVRDGGFERLERTTTPFNPRPVDPLADSSVP